MVMRRLAYLGQCAYWDKPVAVYSLWDNPTRDYRELWGIGLGYAAQGKCSCRFNAPRRASRYLDEPGERAASLIPCGEMDTSSWIRRSASIASAKYCARGGKGASTHCTGSAVAFPSARRGACHGGIMSACGTSSGLPNSSSASLSRGLGGRLRLLWRRIGPPLISAIALLMRRLAGSLVYAICNAPAHPWQRLLSPAKRANSSPVAQLQMP